MHPSQAVRGLGMGAVSPRESVGYRWAKARPRVKSGIHLPLRRQGQAALRQSESARDEGQMAGGFFRGMIHGAAAAAVLIVAGSLVLPLPETAPETAPEVGPETAPETAPEVTPEALFDTRPVAPDTPETLSEETPSAGPALGDLDLPVGSEFGRSGDLPPRLPAPVSGTAALPAPAPAIAPPASETAPVAATGGTEPPETAPDPEAPSRGQPLPSADSPALDLPAAEGAPPPDRPAAPQSSLRAPRDEPPVAPTPADPAPDPAAAAEAPREPVAIPRLHAPALDLSLPPDLSDLRRLERD